MKEVVPPILTGVGIFLAIVLLSQKRVGRSGKLGLSESIVGKKQFRRYTVHLKEIMPDSWEAIISGRGTEYIPIGKRRTLDSSGWKALEKMATHLRNIGFAE